MTKEKMHILRNLKTLKTKNVYRHKKDYQDFSSAKRISVWKCHLPSNKKDSYGNTYDHQLCKICCV